MGKLVTKKIISVTKEGLPIKFYDNPGIEIDPKRQKILYHNFYKILKKKI